MPSRALPESSALHAMLKGRTHAEVAASLGVSRSAITRALGRSGREPKNMRHSNLLPWRVQVRHASHYAARMLRLEGRTQAGQLVSAGDADRLASWKADLRAGDIVILYVAEHNCAYCDGDGGFHPMRRVDAVKRYGQPDDSFDTELIFVTKGQGEALHNRPTHRQAVPAPRPRNRASAKRIA